MNIQKKMGDFRGMSRCLKLREHESLALNTLKNSNYDNAVIVKEIMRRCLTGEAAVSDISDLVDQGVEDDYLVEEAGTRRKNQLVRQLNRAVLSEQRKPHFGERKIISLCGYDISVKPDVIFYESGMIELVLYRAGNPNVVMKGKKRDHTVDQCIELYLLLQYAKTLVEKEDTRIIRASYYFMKKKTDTGGIIRDNDFFSETGGNVVYLEDTYTNDGKNVLSKVDVSFLSQMEEFKAGSACSEDDCKKCAYNTACNYVGAPELMTKKDNLEKVKKAGKIVLSASQEEVVSFKQGICRVNAGAGAGKTECVTQRVTRLIQSGVKPEEILLITFTNAGAAEMKARVAAKCLSADIAVNDDDIKAMTFNTFAFNIVKDKYRDCGFTNIPVVIDEVRNAVIVSQMLDKNNVGGLDYLNYTMNMPNCKGALACATKTFDIIKTNSYSNEDMEEVKADLQKAGFYGFMMNGSISQLLNLYEEYDKRLKEDNLVQFSDQEPLMMKVLDLYPDYLEQFNFRHIIVDEFQDSNQVQIDTIRLLTNCFNFESLMVVGDDSQSIFGFRNTTPENILYFYEKLGKSGTDYFLVDNHRSTPEILELANKINALNEKRIEKDLIATRDHGRTPVVSGFFSKEEEYDYIAGKIASFIEDGVQPEDIAFIAAKKIELVALGAKLSEYNVPWVMMNPMPLKENSKVQAAISLADAFYQPEATKLYFDYLTIKRDGKILDEDDEDVMHEITDLRSKFTNMELMDIPVQRHFFHEMLDEIKGTDEIYAYFLELLYACEDFQSELEYIQNFKRFGDQVSKKMEQSYQGVVLTTAHSSKGLEWKIVFNSITEYDAKPLHKGARAQSDIEEKRRLLFVSMTRARDLLFVTGQYVAYGSKDDRTYNQFLKEVYDCAGLAYNPIDPMEEFKEAERKKKAAEKAEKKRKKVS